MSYFSIDSCQAVRREGEARQRFIFVLVVESDDTLREGIERHLVQHGHFVMGASSATLASELIIENEFDAIIADLLLRDGTSFELMRKLRETRSVPGVSISQYSDTFEHFQSKAAGFSAHLPKPVNLAMLVHHLGRISRQDP